MKLERRHKRRGGGMSQSRGDGLHGFAGVREEANPVRFFNIPPTGFSGRKF